MVRKASISILSFVFILIIAFSRANADTLYAGLRCSQYGFSEGGSIPTKEWIVQTCNYMCNRFITPTRTVIPCVVWIVDTWDASTNDSYLTYFDNNKVKVLLQIEPQDNSDNVVALITQYLSAYKSHPSVIAFGLDIEWYYPEENNGLGRKVTDNDAKTWRTKVKSYNSNYFLLLKHFFPGWLPPAERSGIIFLDDSQQFPSFERFLNETNPSTKWNIGYRYWGNAFKDGISGMQYGYNDADGGPSDRLWWSLLKDPPKEIGDSCNQVSPNTKYLFWVDFTCRDKILKWEYMTGLKEKNGLKVMPASITVNNRTIYIKNSFIINNNKDITVSVFDINGKLIFSKSYQRVSDEVGIKIGKDISKGIYLVKVESNNQVISQRISLR